MFVPHRAGTPYLRKNFVQQDMSGVVPGLLKQHFKEPSKPDFSLLWYLNPSTKNFGYIRYFSEPAVLPLLNTLAQIRLKDYTCDTMVSDSSPVLNHFMQDLMFLSGLQQRSLNVSESVASPIWSMMANVPHGFLCKQTIGSLARIPLPRLDKYLLQTRATCNYYKLHPVPGQTPSHITPFCLCKSSISLPSPLCLVPRSLNALPFHFLITSRLLLISYNRFIPSPTRQYVPRTQCGCITLETLDLPCVFGRRRPQ